MTERQLHLFKGKRQRGTKAPPPSEFELHCMIADTLARWASPGWFYTHFPSGEERPKMAGARLKRMGLMAGIPDFLFFPPSGTADMRVRFLELKRQSTSLSLPQVNFAHWCRGQGYEFSVARSYREAVEILQRWGVVRAEVHVV